MTDKETVQASIDEGKRIIKERRDAKQVTPKEKAARQSLLQPQIIAQHTAAMELPVNAAKIKAIRDAIAGRE